MTPIDPPSHALTCQANAFEKFDGIYLDCANIAPLPLATLREGQRALLRRAHGITPVMRSRSVSRRMVKDAFARLISAPSASHISIVSSVSHAMALLAMNTPLETGDVVLCVDQQFPSAVSIWRQQAESVGATFLQVGSAEETRSLNQALLESIDDNTAVIICPHVHWLHGSCFDLAALNARAKEVNAKLYVDASQSVGAYPISVMRECVDALVTTSYKWLLGPYAFCFLYLSKAMWDGEPFEQTWAAGDERTGLETLLEAPPLPRDASRFDMGECDDALKLSMSLVSLEMIQAWNPTRIQTYLTRWSEPVKATARALGLQSHDHPHASHILALRIDHARSDLASSLAREGVRCSKRGPFLRLSPYIFNTDEDASRVCQLLEEFGHR